MMNAKQKAIDTLKKGGIVIFPTDTAFGIGCRIDNQKAVDRLFEIRKRPRSQATPVLVSSKNQALEYLDNPGADAIRFMGHYWPGALTIIAPCKKKLVHSPIRGDGLTIGIRMPDHNDILDVIRGVGVPILGPSANIHGGKTPHTVSELHSELVSLSDFVLPGICPAGGVSTVVDCSVTPYTVVRKGVVRL